MELGGEYDFRTVEDLTGVIDDFPATGEVRLTAGDTSVRVRAWPEQAMADHAQVDLDDGSGAYESVDPIVWRSLVRALFGAPNSRPTIERLSITPDKPRTDDVLSVSYRASDPDRDYVTLGFDWYRNGILVKQGSEGYLEARFTEKHDRVEVEMTMSDARWTANETAETAIENSPPVITGLAIVPNLRTTIDDLIANFGLADADGDELDQSYQWTVNDLVSEHAGVRLPAASHRKGDNVSFRIDADDGEASTGKETTTQIVDAPPRVTVDSPPPEVMFGDRVVFSASVDDPDGEPVDQLRYRIAYGPPGMTVDAESGEIDWTPALPMFDRQMEVAWAVEVDHEVSAPASGVILLRDPDRQYPFMRQARVGFEGRFRMGDFDADGTVEIMGGPGDATFVWTGETYEQAWGYPFAPAGSGLHLAATADVDSDGRHEIFLFGDGHVTRLDGVDRRYHASARLRMHRLDAAEAADLDGDGDVELVCMGDGNGRTISVLDARELTEVWHATNAAFGRTLAVGNVDDDQALEIVTGRGYIIDGATFENERIGDWLVDNVAIGDVDGDGIDEILGSTFGRIQAYDVDTRRTLWEFDVDEPGLVAAGDVDGDTVDEILIGGNSGLSVYRRDGEEGPPKLWDHIETTDGYSVTTILVGDSDGDAETEIVWSKQLGYSYVARTRPDFALEWSNHDIPPLSLLTGGGLVPGPHGNDVLLFVALGSFPAPSRLVAISPVDGRVTVGATLEPGHSQWTGDYDRDGRNEMILSLVSREGETPELVAYDYSAGGPAWVQRGPSSSAAAIAAVDTNGDGNAELATVAAYFDPRVSVYDVANDKRVFESEPIPGRGLDVAFVGHGSNAEVVAASEWGANAHLVTYSQDGTDAGFVEKARYGPGRDIVDMMIAEVDDGDGANGYEVLFLTRRSYLGNPVHILDQSLTPKPDLSVDGGAVTRLVGVRHGSDGRRNLLMEVVRDRRHRLESWDMDAGVKIWESPVLRGSLWVDAARWVTVNGKTVLSLFAGNAIVVTR